MNHDNKEDEKQNFLPDKKFSDFFKPRAINQPFFRPGVTLFFILFWFCLNGWSWGNLLFALILSLFLSHIFVLFDLPPLRVKRWRFCFILFFYVLKDILGGYLKLAFWLCKYARQGYDQYTVFVTLPLHIHDRQLLALLHCLISLSPGALWLSYNAKEHSASFHILDSADEKDFCYKFIHLYQPLLAGIFNTEDVCFKKLSDEGRPL